jgi:predicted restriction endonuclease
MSDCGVQAVLKAAHIVRYQGGETNHVCNGLLLRADLHTLFDLRMIAVDVSTMTVLVAPVLANTQYGEFGGRSLRLPTRTDWRPNREALEMHRQECGL